MNKVPIVFSFDDNIVQPAIVCFSSMLLSRKEDTFYQIYVLYISLSEENQDKIKNALIGFKNISISFTNCNDSFKFSEASVSRGITQTAYLRLLIPKLLKEYKKVIYSDVDVIVQQDLSCLLDWKTDKKIYGIRAGDEKNSHDERYKLSIGCDPINYINSGILVLNNEFISDDDINQCLELVHAGYTYQDQDIINIVYKGNIDASMPPKFAIIPGRYKSMLTNPERWQKFYTQEQILDLSLATGIIHYAGRKPWNTRVDLGEIWWANYFKSPIFNSDIYYNYLNRLAFLPFSKEPIVKILKKFS